MLPIAGREWELRLDAQPEQIAELQHANAWLFSVLGLMAASLLGALLLIVTGRARRIELAVEERTARAAPRGGRAPAHRRGAARQRAALRGILDTVRVGIV